MCDQPASWCRIPASVSFSEALLVFEARFWILGDGGAVVISSSKVQPKVIARSRSNAFLAFCSGVCSFVVFRLPPLVLDGPVEVGNRPSAERAEALVTRLSASACRTALFLGTAALAVREVLTLSALWVSSLMQSKTL